jgi:DNA-binding SARP family transcriptional activator
LLAFLLLNRNTSVSWDTLVDGLWRSPENSRHKLDVAVSRLRVTFEAARLPRDLILTTTTGYLLRVEGDQVDAERFELLLKRGRELVQAGRFSEAEESLAQALGLWRGDALADVRHADFAQDEARRLDELRVAATEELIDARIGIGHTAEVVAELGKIIAAHPLRERPRAQLMRALHGAGRRAEALEAYRDARRVLVDELGLEPSAELRGLEREILTADVASPNAMPEIATPSRAPPRRGVRPFVPALAAILLVLAASAAPSRTTQARVRPLVLPPNWVAVINPQSNRVVRRLRAGERPVAVAIGEGAAWVANANDETVTRIDLKTYRTETVGVASPPADIVVSNGSVWVAMLSPVLVRVHAGSVRVAGTVPADPGRFGFPGVPGGGGTLRNRVNSAHLTAGAGSVWLANSTDGGPQGILFRVDPNDGAATKFRTTARADSRQALAFGNGALWSGRAIGGDEFDPDDGDSPPPYVLYRTDPRTGHVVARLDLRVPPTALAFGGGSGWLAQNSGRRVSQIDERFATVERTITLPAAPTDIAADDDSVWVASADARALYRLDQNPLRLVATIKLGRQPESIAVGGGRVWVVGA